VIPGAIVPAEGRLDDRFGSAVAAQGALVAIGSPGVDEPEPDAGAVHLFERSEVTFTPLAVLSLAECELEDCQARWGDRFGASVAFSGGLLLVGAPGIDAPLRDSGAVFVYEGEGSSWSLVQRELSPAPFTGQLFGSSIATTDDGAVVVGAAGADSIERDVGAAIIFRIVDSRLEHAADATTAVP